MNFCIICSRMYQDKLASLKRQLQQLHEGNHCLLSDLGNGQTQAQEEKMLFYVDVHFWYFLFFCRDPAGIPKEDEKTGPAVQREASKCRQAKNILSSLSY